MKPDVEQKLRELVRARIAKQKVQIDHSLKQIDAGNPLGAEPSEERSTAFIARTVRLPVSDARAMSTMIARTASIIDSGTDLAGAEKNRGPTIDTVGVEFLARGRFVANSVGRVAFRSGRYEGSGFLVGNDLFLTNNHVMPGPEAASQLMAQFDYEAGLDGIDIPVTSFSFDAESCFVTDPIDGLDFTLVAIGQRLSGEKPLSAFGYMPLSDAKDKHMLGILANVIQHPLGDLKQVVVRDNNLISRDDTEHVLHYIADTDNGSSGSPVCNNSWEPIALHHWGEAHHEVKDAQGRPLNKEVNEGIRISAIVTSLRERLAALPPPTAERISELLTMWDTSKQQFGASPRTSGDKSQGESGASKHVGSEALRDLRLPRPARSELKRMSDSAEITWQFPIEITVRAPLAQRAVSADAEAIEKEGGAIRTESAKSGGQGREAARKSTDFSDRGGYEAGFIPGFIVPLPDYSKVGYPMAVNQHPLAEAEDPHELPYHHFSILMNADRRLASFTACNIDGRRLVAVNRADKSVNLDPTLKDLGAEASDAFSRDDRVKDSEQMAVEFYQDQEVPGYPKPEYPGADATKAARSTYAKLMSARTARMFQKGHITLRGDPAWGTEDQAIVAEADTFFYTNAAPQLGYFNQGSAEDRPGSKGKLRWRAVETYVLRNAFTRRQRVTVFAGPIFDEKRDIPYRDHLVPAAFWKIVVWADKKKLKSIALLADQKAVLEKLTEGVPEAYQDEDELDRVSDFLTTVSEIETLTGLKFGREVGEADVRRGAEHKVSSIAAPPGLLDT